MVSDNLEEQLLAALSRTGYPLEMRTASMARQVEPPFMYVHQSRQYVDPETDKVREADVLICDAEFSLYGWTFHYAIVECKAGSSPWVVFTEGEPSPAEAEASAEERATRLQGMLFSEFGDVTPFSERIAEQLFPGPSLFDVTLQGHGLATPLKGDSQNPAWNAARQALSAATGFLKDIDPEVNDPFAIVVHPVVVTSSALFACWLGEDREPAIREVPVAEVMVRRDLDTLTRVNVIQERYWNSWLQRFRLTTLGLGKPLGANS